MHPTNEGVHVSPVRGKKKATAPKGTASKASKAKPVDTRAGKDRRTGVDRRQVDVPVANDRRSGIDRRTGVDRRRYRGMEARLRMRLVLVLGVVLAYPPVRTWSDGALAVDAMAIRVAIAFGFAGLAVSAVNTLFVMYAPKPNPAPLPQQHGIEDAATVDEPASGDRGQE